jgi:DNA-binding CsgD family transcriptional regulator
MTPSHRSYRLLGGLSRGSGRCRARLDPDFKKKIVLPPPASLQRPHMFTRRLFHDPLVEPTARELEILRLVCDGHSTKEIAARLHLSFGTVACHRTRLMEKSGAKNSILLFRWALQNGYVQWRRAEETAPAVGVGVPVSGRSFTTPGRGPREISGAAAVSSW